MSRVKLISTTAIDPAQKKKLKNASQNASETVVKEIHQGSFSNGEDVYNAIRAHLSGAGVEFEVARRYTLWVIKNFPAIQKLARQGVSTALKAMGELLAAATWWQVLAAAVGGLIVGGVACGVALKLGAPPVAAASVGLLAGVVGFFGILAAIVAE